MRKDSSAKLITLSIVFLVMINFPILAIFDREQLLFGVPSLFFYLFTAWLIVIAFTFWINTKNISTRSMSSKTSEESDHPDPAS